MIWRRWGFVVRETLMSGAVDRYEWPVRYWTRGRAERAAEEFARTAHKLDPDVEDWFLDHIRTEIKKFG